MIILCRTSNLQKTTTSNTKTSGKNNFKDNSSNIKTCLNSNDIKITSNFAKFFCPKLHHRNLSKPGKNGGLPKKTRGKSLENLLNS